MLFKDKNLPFGAPRTLEFRIMINENAFTEFKLEIKKGHKKIPVYI